jgi:CDP-glucose 4,6-dehydratase
VDWEKQSVLITGVDGFIGSHLAKRLLESGARVNGISRRELIAGKSGLMVWELQNKITNYIGDVAEKEFVNEVIHESKPQWIFHLAAQAIVSKGQGSPLDTFQTNVAGSLNMVVLSQDNLNLKGIIVASSDKAYGNSDILPYTEGVPLRGGAIYDTSKACADMLSSCLSTWMDIPLGITRCANTYGPGDLNFSRIIPESMREIAAGRPPVIRGDGLHERDFIYIDDVVSGYLRIAEYIAINKPRGEAFNLGTGVSTRVVDLVNQILSLDKSGIKSPQVLGEAKPAEISRQYVDWTKARKKLNWRPEYTLEEGLTKTLQWYMDYFR